MINFTREFVTEMNSADGRPQLDSGKGVGLCLFASACISLNQKLRGMEEWACCTLKLVSASKDIGNAGMSQRSACVGIL